VTEQTEQGLLSDPISKLPSSVIHDSFFGNELLISALRFMSVKQIKAVPVIDPVTRQFIGELSLAQLEVAGLEKCLTSLQSPVADFIKNYTATVPVSPETSVMQALTLLVKQKADHICVVVNSVYQRHISAKELLGYLAVQK
jgi:CBS-domain-containing membrane protein